MSGSQSYDEIAGIGELYDNVRLYVERPDVPFYIEEARNAAGPALELACGTGRVLLPTARAGVEIAGLDRGNMLARAKEKLARESSDVQRRVRLDEGDMRAFDLQRTFSLVTIPFRGFQHVVTIDDQVSCLRNIRRTLAPGGRLVFDVFRPEFSYMVPPRTEEHEDTPSTPLPGGRTFRRAARVTAVDFLTQISQVEIIWYVTDASGRETRQVQAFPMRWYMRAEMEHLLARAGFRTVDVYGDFDRSPLTAASNEMIFVAEASPAS